MTEATNPTSPTRPPATPVLPDWGVTVRTRAPVGALAGAALGALGLVALAWLVAGPLAAVVVGVALVAGVAWVRLAGRSALRSAGAVPLAAGAAPRVENIVGGLARDLGTRAPGLWSAPGGPNVLVAWSGGPQVALTTEMIEQATRTELEAVLAHALVRLITGEARWSTYGTMLPGMPQAPLSDIDVEAAAVTRYPPGLAAAIRRCEARGGRTARLWLVRAGEDAEERVRALLDL